jgi:putative selenate reductase
VGFDRAKKVLDALGFHYLRFGQASFDNDLPYSDAVPMLRRLRERAAALGLFFGVKLTNTFAVKADHGELPDKNIYMSGRALLPLSLRVAMRLRLDFGDTLPMSYCGGADAKNIALLARTGLFPITVCTELLKPGGYEKLYAMATALEGAKSARETRKSAVFDDLTEVLNNVLARNIPTPHRALQVLDTGAKANCRAACGICASVCPNRANVIITVDGKRQMLHLDGLCNECGNCASFCAEKTLPYRCKLTVFTDRTALEESQNAGFAFLPESGRFLLRWADICREVAPEDEGVPPEVGRVMAAVRDAYPWLMYR